MLESIRKGIMRLHRTVVSSRLLTMSALLLGIGLATAIIIGMALLALRPLGDPSHNWNTPRDTSPSHRAPAIRLEYECRVGGSLVVIAEEERVRIQIADGREVLLTQGEDIQSGIYTSADARFMLVLQGNTAAVEQYGEPLYSGCLLVP